MTPEQITALETYRQAHNTAQQLKAEVEELTTMQAQANDIKRSIDLRLSRKEYVFYEAVKIERDAQEACRETGCTIAEIGSALQVQNE